MLFLIVCVFTFCSKLLFADANFNITRLVIGTLSCRDQLRPSVVVLFVYLLNHSKKLKNPQSTSSRVFFIVVRKQFLLFIIFSLNIYITPFFLTFLFLMI